MIRRRRLWCFILLLALAGPVAPAHAADGGWTGLDRVWAWLESWLPWTPMSDQSFTIDPNGGSSATSDQGSWIDPNGGSSATSDQSLTIDPNG